MRGGVRGNVSHRLGLDAIDVEGAHGHHGVRFESKFDEMGTEE